MNQTNEKQSQLFGFPGPGFHLSQATSFAPVAAGWREPSSTTLSLGCAHIIHSSQAPTAHTAQTLGGGDALDTGPQRREPMNGYKTIWTFAGFAVS